MNNIGKRKNRPPSGRRLRPTIDKAMYSEGIYANPRIVHTGTSLVGCIAQVLVKNGNLYEGIFRTFSPKMDVVLELAHLVEDGDDDCKIPLKERLVEKIVFNINDIVMITALNVDLDYASKDNFTDTSISKFNGQVTERELQPWEGDADSPLEALGSGEIAENGWDANEMFNTNESKFNVKSNYDPNLSQYTTMLSKCDTEEYREREAMASRMANEIEKSPSFQHHANLENGDGDDEELQFSAVVRTNDSNSTDGASNSGSGRYVAPHRRNGQQGRPVRTPGHAPPSMHGQAPPSKQAHHMMASPTGPPHSRDDNSEGGKVNLGKDDRRGEGQMRMNHSDVNNVAANADVRMDLESERGDLNKLPNPKDRELKELKDFQTNFKLSENETKEKQLQQQQQQHAAAALLPPPENHIKNSSCVQEMNSQVKTSLLNPEAAEFVPKQMVQTPPRLPSQSPAMMQQQQQLQQQQQQQQQQPMQQQAMYPHAYMMPVSMAGLPPSNHMMAANGQQQARFTKRAVVSIRPEYGPAAQAAAATGQPLMAAQTAVPTAPQAPYTLPYMPPHMMAPPGQQVYQQIVQVPVQGGRLMGSHLQNSLAEQNCVLQMGQAQTPIYMNQPQQASGGVMPGQMGGNPHHPHAIPAHLGGPLPQSHSQPSHPTQSPVQQQQPGGGPPQQVSHPPPSSGTPQPQPIIYQMPQQPPTGGHPPLQPSPHTPTSPHTVYPPAMYATQYSYGGQQQGMPPPQGLQVQPPNMGHPHQQPPQFVMMQQHPPGQVPQNQQQAQQQPQQHQQQHIQLQQHMHHMQAASLANQGGPPMVPPQGTMNASTGSVQQQMAYMSHHQMQPHPLAMQNYHHAQ